MRRTMRWLIVWLVHVGLWLLYVSQVNVWEILVGAAGAGLATLGVSVVKRAGQVKFKASVRELAQARWLPWYACSGTWEVLQGIAKQLFSKSGAPSYLAAVPFEPVADRPTCSGNRVLAVLYTTMTPNFVVVGVIREQGLLLYHQIIPGEVLQLTQNLGARP